MIQVENEHYSFNKYTDFPRWTSYWHQIDETLKFKPNSVLIIGIGDDIVPRTLNNYVAKLETFDIDPKLNPTYMGKIDEVDKIVSDDFDVILCCQVLEHIQFELFDKTLNKLSYLAKNMVVSLPYCHHKFFNVNIELPLLGIRNFHFSIPKFYKKWKFDGEHYWEIGASNYLLSDVKNKIVNSFNIINTFSPINNLYHKFFILESKNLG